MLRLGHSPDPDDAFMWWPLYGRAGEGPAIDTGRFEFTPVAEDIETLNERSETGDLEITAMSCAQYPRVRDTYALTACGASLGDGYGPKLVASRPATPEELVASGATIAIPGRRTTAFLAASLRLGPGAFRFAAVPFDEIIDRVRSGDFDAGVVIHEGQLTFADAGLHLVVDLGAWWRDETSQLLPLGANAIRRDLEDQHGPGTLAEITRTLRRSVEHALAHREASLDYALGFARGIESSVADRFVEMYVNAWTLDYGPDGRAAVRSLLRRAHQAGLVPDPGEVDFVEPGRIHVAASGPPPIALVRGVKGVGDGYHGIRPRLGGWF